MGSHRFQISSEVLDAFPDMQVAAVKVTGLKVALTSVDGAERLAKAVQAVAHLFLTPEELVADPRIEGWRKAYGAMGAKPSKFRSSIEALARRAVKNAALSTQIAVVDLYNAVSLEALAPLGAYDTALLPPDGFSMRLADPAQDQFNPLGGTAADFPLHKELVVYASGNKVLCWGFNCRDSAETCLSDATDEAIFIGEAAFPVHHTALQRGLRQLHAICSEIGAECGEIEVASHAKPGFTV